MVQLLAGASVLGLAAPACGGTLEDDYRRGQRSPSTVITTTTIAGA